MYVANMYTHDNSTPIIGKCTLSDQELIEPPKVVV